MSRIIERGNDSHLVADIDKTCKNKFRWEWLETLIDVNGRQVPLSQYIRKIDSAGKAKCLTCERVINYGSRGKVSLLEHCKSGEHTSKVKTVVENQKLPAYFTGQLGDTPANSTTYGVHPFFANVKKAQIPTGTVPCVSYEDRVATAQAMVLGVIAEHSLPMTMAPVLINLAKELSKDKKVLDDLSMDRTSASYKMTYGLSKTIHQETVRHLQTTPFSLNIDETTTSANNKHIVTVLVNYFNAQENKVVLEQLASRELIRVNAESLFEFLDELFEQNEIPWANLVSILMDSCSVMRGCKNGLEVRVRREKAPHLLDIDGDLCHHMHNGCKKFCEPFESWVEKLFNHLHVDFKYSTDLREALSEICTILNIKFTVPERFLNHRWLSAYDEKAFRKILACYVKPEIFIALNGRELSKLNLESDNGQFLDETDMFIGSAATKLLVNKRRDDPVIEKFMKKASAAYVITGSYLQKKLPLTNKVLRLVSSLDPAERGTTNALKSMKRLPGVITSVLTPVETDQFVQEVYSYNSSDDLPCTDDSTRFDCWWGDVSASGSYPALSKLALAVCTIFHGPLVEASFNTMGDILDAKTSSLGIETYSAIQTVKYCLKTRNTSAIEYFRRTDFLYSSVNGNLCMNMKLSSSRYRNILKEKNETSNNRKPLSKAIDCRMARENAESSHLRHEKQRKREGRMRLLEDLAMQRKSCD